MSHLNNHKVLFTKVECPIALSEEEGEWICTSSKRKWIVWREKDTVYIKPDLQKRYLSCACHLSNVEPRARDVTFSDEDLFISIIEVGYIETKKSRRKIKAKETLSLTSAKALTPEDKLIIIYYF